MIVFLVLYLFTTITISQTLYLPNIDCGPYVDYVRTDPRSYYRYTPYYVKLHRCHGANSVINPRNKYCAADTDGIRNLSIYVVNKSNQSVTTITVQNHTKCSETCSIDKSSCTPYQSFSKIDCACTCNYAEIPDPNPCKYPFEWDSLMCNCMCSIESKVCEIKRKVFSREACDCVCKQKFHVRCARRGKVVNRDTCECIEPSSVETGETKGLLSCKGDIDGGVLALLMILEAVVIVLMYLILYQYCYKRVYLVKHQEKENEKIMGDKQIYDVDAPSYNKPEVDSDDTCTQYTHTIDLNKDSNDDDYLDVSSCNDGNYHESQEITPLSSSQDGDIYYTHHNKDDGRKLSDNYRHVSLV